jgi:hypothetical protein
MVLEVTTIYGQAIMMQGPRLSAPRSTSHIRTVPTDPAVTCANAKFPTSEVAFPLLMIHSFCHSFKQPGMSDATWKDELV